MKILAAVFLLGFALACSSAQPAQTPDYPPGASVPGSPATVWNEPGGPSNPGVPGAGPVTEEDAGVEAEGDAGDDDEAP